MPQPRSWRWTSTPLSADRGEISVLACVESIVAIALTVGIAWHRQSIDHILIAACFVPLLLLRRKRSCLLGIAYANSIFFKFYRFTEKNKDRKFLIGLAMFGTIVLEPIVVVFIRFISIFQQFLEQPLKSIASIPFNWKRIVLCMDSAHQPEILPGSERLAGRRVLGRETFILTFRKFNNWFVEKLFRLPKKKDTTPIEIAFLVIYNTAMIVVFSAATILSFFLSFLYRMSLRSTALIWAPLLWVVSSARVIGSIKIRLMEICNLSIYKVMRLYSFIIAVLFGIKILILIGPQKALLSADLRPLLEPFIEPARLPVWQIASFINALLAFILLFLSDYYLKAIEFDKSDRPSDSSMKAHIGLIALVRNMLAIYTIGCTIYILWKVSLDVELPYIEFLLFPWS